MNLSIIKMVVGIIGIVLVLCVIGIIYLVTQERAIPSTLETITALSVGGLLGLLAPTNSTS